MHTVTGLPGHFPPPGREANSEISWLVRESEAGTSGDLASPARSSASVSRRTHHLRWRGREGGADPYQNTWPLKE